MAGRPQESLPSCVPYSSVTLGSRLRCLKARFLKTPERASTWTVHAPLAFLLCCFGAGPLPSPSRPIHLYLQRARSVMSGWGKMGTCCLRGRRGPRYPGSSSSTAVSNSER